MKLYKLFKVIYEMTMKNMHYKLMVVGKWNYLIYAKANGREIMKKGVKPKEKVIGKTCNYYI